MTNDNFYRPDGCLEAASTDAQALCFSVENHPRTRLYSLSDVRLRGFERETDSEPLSIASADQWELVATGSRAGWWGSTNHEHGSTGTLTSSVFTIADKGRLCFAWQPSSEQSNDILSYVLRDADGVSVRTGTTSGAMEAEDVELLLGAGSYTLTFRYTKDSGTSAYDDRGYVTGLRVHHGVQAQHVIADWPKGLTMYVHPTALMAGWTLVSATQTSASYDISDNGGAQALAAFLNGLRFRYNCPVSGCIRVRVITQTDDLLFFDERGIQHYYRFVRDNIGWTQAYNLAKRTALRGMTGYLATVTSARETEALKRVEGSADGWLGGARRVYADGSKILDQSALSIDPAAYLETADTWYWCDGPEAGQVFSVGKVAPVAVPPGVYTDWITNEPSNGETTEESALMLKRNRPGSWNDEGPYVTDHAVGYYLEFSPYGQQRDEGEVIASARIPAECVPDVPLHGCFPDLFC